jgi:hypothetical protein
MSTNTIAEVALRTAIKGTTFIDICAGYENGRPTQMQNSQEGKQKKKEGYSKTGKLVSALTMRNVPNNNWEQ